MRLRIEFEFEYGWQYVDFNFFLFMTTAASVQGILTFIIFHLLIHRRRPKFWFWLLYWVMWVPYVSFVLWYLLVCFPIGQNWIIRFLYWRFEYKFIDIHFLWIWDPMFRFLAWITGGYRPQKIFMTYRDELPFLLALKEGCVMYREFIIGSMEENLRSRHRNEENYRYYFSNRTHPAYKKHYKDFSHAIHLNEVLIQRHERFIGVIESFADDALKRKRAVNCRILRGALKNLTRELSIWKKTFIINRLSPVQEPKVYFGPKEKTTGFWSLFYD